MGVLTATAVRAAKSPGRYGDGDGLFLFVGNSGNRSWVCRVQKDGRRRDIGLGSEKKVSLAQARQLAAEVRSQVQAGIDPVAERKRREGIPTFREAAAKVFAEHKKNWRNAKHRAQWLSSLEAYAFPVFGDVAVSEVEGPVVRDALVAIWLEKPETARRVRQRIVSVIDWAIAKGYRTLPLPIAAINKSLPKVRKRDAPSFTNLSVFIDNRRKGRLSGVIWVVVNCPCLLILAYCQVGPEKSPAPISFDFTRLHSFPLKAFSGGRVTNGINTASTCGGFRRGAWPF